VRSSLRVASSDFLERGTGARFEFVATPYGRRHVGYQVQQALRLTWIVAQSLRTCDRLGDVGDDAVPPAAYLVPEDPEAPCQAAPDRAFCNNATLDSIVVTNWRLLDHEPP
jgi:hypothetical protein